MINTKRKSGFTLIEVLISAGILSIGFMLIAGAFPVGMKLTAMATERTIGSVAAQEAIAKMKIHGLRDTIPNLLTDPLLFPNHCVDYETVAGLDFIPTPNTPMDDPWDFSLQFSQFYPSTIATDIDELKEKKYHWSALCRYTGPIPVDGPVPIPVDGSGTVQVTVFVSRLGGAGVEYPAKLTTGSSVISEIYVPKPILMPAIPFLTTDSLNISTISGYTTYFREGSVIVDDSDGELYTVMERTDNGNTIVLNRSLVNTVAMYDFWVLPSSIKTSASGGTPPTLGGRWPCVWVFQDIIKF